MSFKFSAYSKQIINNIFRIIGAAAAAANLLCEFKIAEKKDAKLIKNKNGNVILVKSIAIFNFSDSFVNPGAIILINAGMNISIIKIVKNKPSNNKLKIVFANEFAYLFPLRSSEEYDGINAALNVPSENNLLKVFGILKATKKASAKGPEPRYIAIKKSLM